MKFLAKVKNGLANLWAKQSIIPLIAFVFCSSLLAFFIYYFWLKGISQENFDFLSIAKSMITAIAGVASIIAIYNASSSESIEEKRAAIAKLISNKRIQ